MKKMALVAILAAVTALVSPGEADVAYAQILCTGHARQVGRGVVGTMGPDVIDCSESRVGVTIAGLVTTFSSVGKGTISSWPVRATTGSSAGQGTIS